MHRIGEKLMRTCAFDPVYMMHILQFVYASIGIYNNVLTQMCNVSFQQIILKNISETEFTKFR